MKSVPYIEEGGGGGGVHDSLNTDLQDQLFNRNYERS